MHQGHVKSVVHYDKFFKGAHPSTYNPSLFAAVSALCCLEFFFACLVNDGIASLCTEIGHLNTQGILGEGERRVAHVMSYVLFASVLPGHEKEFTRQLGYVEVCVFFYLELQFLLLVSSIEYAYLSYLSCNLH